MAGSEEQVLRNLALRHSAAFAPASAAAGVIGASSVLAVLAGRADVNKLTIWFGAILLSHLLVVLTSHRVLRLDPTRPRFEWALRARWASLAASGAAWGILVLLPAGPQTPIAVRSIGLIVAGGMIGISSARAGDRLGFWCFWIPVTGSMLSALVLAGDAALVAAIAVLAAYAALANRRYSSAVVDLLRVEHQNESLVSQLRDQARELERAASTDPLTGAANRREFDRILHDARGGADTGIGVILFDLDGFKAINDELGHVVGDQLLVAITERATACLRAQDVLARWGGDEFAVLLPGACNRETVDGVIERLRTIFDTPFPIEDRNVRAAASFGGVPGDLDAGYEALVRNADAALYANKRGRVGA